MPKPQDAPPLAEASYARPDFWLGGKPEGEEPRVFVPPSPPKKNLGGGESLKEDNWIGGGHGQSPIRRSNKDLHPAPIKIEGSCSVKNSPFFK